MLLFLWLCGQAHLSGMPGSVTCRRMFATMPSVGVLRVWPGVCIASSLLIDIACSLVINTRAFADSGPPPSISTLIATTSIASTLCCVLALFLRVLQQPCPVPFVPRLTPKLNLLLPLLVDSHCSWFLRLLLRCLRPRWRWPDHFGGSPSVPTSVFLSPRFPVRMVMCRPWYLKHPWKCSSSSKPKEGDLATSLTRRSFAVYVRCQRAFGAAMCP